MREVVQDHEPVVREVERDIEGCCKAGAHILEFVAAYRRVEWACLPCCSAHVTSEWDTDRCLVNTQDTFYPSLCAYL